MIEPNDQWPPLPLAEWRSSYETLHLWTQIVGKIRIALTPLVNHWWNSTLYVTARGLTTSPIPYRGGAFEIRFDFVDHRLTIEPSWERPVTFELQPQSCADFWTKIFAALRGLGIDVEISPVSCELPQPIHLDRDREHATYDREQVNRWWRVLLAADTVLKEFRARFIGKCSPVHFFWGSFDLAVTRFSGRRAPERPGADPVTAEAYSHEVISAGFWPGGDALADAAFYAYAAPQPSGFELARARPAAGRFDSQLGEYILMYDDVRAAASPREALLDFLQSTYEAGATLGGWDRKALERSENES